MTQKTRTIYMPPKGDGGSFNEDDATPEYAREFVNFNIAADGGIRTIDTFTTVNGINMIVSLSGSTPTIGKFHELIKQNGETLIFLQSGRHLIRTSAVSTATPVTATTWTSGKEGPIRSVQMGSKLIFVDGTGRNFYTEDGSSFSPLLAVLEKGQISSTSASATQLSDADITNWITQTNVNVNDLVRNVTNVSGATSPAWGLITAISTAAITHTRIDASALGNGLAVATQQAGNRYVIEDLVELNVIPVADAINRNIIDYDNVAVIGSPSSATGIYVSGVGVQPGDFFTWKQTEIRVGDVLYNSTRNVVTEVTAVETSAIRCNGISTQIPGDTLVFLKSAMPIARFAHVHYNRLYLIDDRDHTKIRISGAFDPEDMSTDSATIDSVTFQFGTQQPEPDRAIGMTTFQRFLVIGGQKNVYVFDGTDPIKDVSAASGVLGESSQQDFNIVGLFPQGITGPDSMLSIGNDVLLVTRDGVQSLSLGSDSSTLNRNDLSESVRGVFTDNTVVSIFHYPQNNWISLNMVVTSAGVATRKSYVYNYAPYLGRNQPQQAQGISQAVIPGGAWQIVDAGGWGKDAYFVGTDEELYAAEQQVSAVRLTQLTTSVARPFAARMTTSWLNMNEPKDSNTIKEGRYIQPYISMRGGALTSAANITFVASARSYDYRAVNSGATDDSWDSFTITSGLSYSTSNSTSFHNDVYPLLWRGQRVRFTIAVSVDSAQVSFSRFTVNYNESGNP